MRAANIIHPIKNNKKINADPRVNQAINQVINDENVRTIHIIYEERPYWYNKNQQKREWTRNEEVFWIGLVLFCVIGIFWCLYKISQD